MWVECESAELSQIKKRNPGCFYVCWRQAAFWELGAWCSPSKKCPRLTAGLVFIVSRRGELWRLGEHRTESNQAKGLGKENRTESCVSLSHSCGKPTSALKMYVEMGTTGTVLSVCLGSEKSRKGQTKAWCFLGRMMSWRDWHFCLFVSIWQEQNTQSGGG